ncbi:MAG TPA: glycosyltransferase family 4 protein, partial [Draconibacterium sp.]|nr:glycosyltransferase family 4 protein [Draconibacterium sp.]
MEIVKSSNGIIPKYLSKQILTIGPQHINHRGGVGAVIDSYSKYFDEFKYIKSQKPGSTLTKSVTFIQCLILLFWKLLTDEHLKIIHIHGASRGSFYRKYVVFLIAKYLFRKKLYYHIHGAEYHLFYAESKAVVKKRITKLINNADGIICLSTKWKAFFESNFKPKRIFIVSNIIDYPVHDARKVIGNQLTFLFLGQIGERKGIFDILKVLSKNKSKYEGKLQLVIGGNGELDKLNAIISKYGLETMVDFVGWISKSEKANWLQKSNVYILPSYNEGLPISILEAMSYGHPIISTNVGGISEIVKPGKNGILIEPGNLEQIESAIDFFLHSYEKIETYGKVSKKMVKKHLPKSVIAELLTI